MFVFLRCVGEAVAARGVKALAGLVPMGEQVYEIAADAIERYRDLHREKQIRQDLEKVIQADLADIRQDAHDIAVKVLNHRAAEDVIVLEQYLTNIPSVIRHSLKRPEEPSGKTVNPTLDLLDPMQFGSLLPRSLPQFHVGDTVPHAPQWRFVELLGSGGFGEVWLARHSFLDQERAIKFCLDPDARERLLQHEGEVVRHVMANTHHYGIVPLVDAFLEGEIPWLAYEYIDGGDLSSIIRQNAELSFRQRGMRAVNCVMDLATIVGQFHRLPQPIIHRDLKPANILIKKIKNKFLLHVTDFGISHVKAENAIRIANTSKSSRNLGATYRGAHTPIYASPQQKRGDKPDVRDDVHAIGIIGWQLLIGDLQAERPAGRSFRRRVADCLLTEEIMDVLESCWDDEPDERPQNAAVLAETLRKLLLDQSGDADRHEHTEKSIKVETFSTNTKRQLYVRSPSPSQDSTQSSTKSIEPQLKSFPLSSSDAKKHQEYWAKVVGVPLLRKTKIGMTFSFVPPGIFLMGSPEDEDNRDTNELQHKVTITKGFYVATTPVTKAQWQMVLGNKPPIAKEEDLPVNTVTWHECLQFVNRINENEEFRLLPNKTGRYSLLTEAQWEYACRAGTTTAFYCGNDLEQLKKVCKCSHNGRIGSGRCPKKVGSLLPNCWGLYDMHGNIAEWCMDWYGNYSRQEQIDPRGPNYGKSRVIRGGTWYYRPEHCRSASRARNFPTSSNDLIGFRICYNLD